VIVPDFSENNAEPSFVRLRLGGARLVGLKASEGITFVDGTLAARARRARLARVRRIFYHFARPDLHPGNARSEADHFLAVVSPLLRKSDYLALDLERGHPDTALVLWCRTFNHRVHERTGRWPLFYANRDYCDRLQASFPIGGGLWLAEYGPNDGREHPVSAPKPWRQLKLHQYTSVGRIKGASPPTDLSAAHVNL
jgi:GH25 family lysozyme M1 (1,4-beta-N-acetylmuramidase)